MPSPAAIAQQQLGDAARAYSRAWKLKGRNVTGLQAVRLAQLHDAARVFAQKTDEEWAAEVVELKRLMRHGLKCRAAPCDDCERFRETINEDA